VSSSSAPTRRQAQYYPAFLDLADRKVVVVGAGPIAAGKVRGLLPCAPDPLLVVAPEACHFIVEQAEAGSLEWQARPFDEADLEDAHLVIAATADRAVNASVAAAARQRGLPVLAVDDPTNCDFIAPAVVRRGDVVVAVSTNGRSPALARRTRDRLEESLPPYWGSLLDAAAAARQRLRGHRASATPERWQAALNGDVEQLAAAGATEQATEELVRRLLPERTDGPTILAKERA
jgi:siroheme synthase-like protein